MPAAVSPALTGECFFLCCISRRMRSSLMRISPSTRARRSASCSRRLPSRSRCSSASRALRARSRLGGSGSHTRALGLFPSPTFFRFAGGAIRRLFGLALCLGLRARGLLLLLDPVVLDPAQLAQRKQNRVLTWTLAAAHERGLTISVTRFSVDFNAPSLGRSTLARKSEASATVGDAPGIENDLLRLLERREQFVDDVVPLLSTTGLRAGLAFVIRAALRDRRLRILLARAVVRAAVATASDRRRLRIAAARSGRLLRGNLRLGLRFRDSERRARLGLPRLRGLQIGVRLRGLRRDLGLFPILLGDFHRVVPPQRAAQSQHGQQQ